MIWNSKLLWPRLRKAKWLGHDVVKWNLARDREPFSGTRFWGSQGVLDTQFPRGTCWKRSSLHPVNWTGISLEFQGLLTKLPSFSSTERRVSSKYRKSAKKGRGLISLFHSSLLSCTSASPYPLPSFLLPPTWPQPTLSLVQAPHLPRLSSSPSHCFPKVDV